MTHYFVIWHPKKSHECKSFQEADGYARDLIKEGKRGVSILTTNEPQPFKEAI